MHSASASRPPDPPPNRVVKEPSSTRSALTFVYVAYAFRYVYLAVLVPFYGRVLGAAEYGRVLAAMSLFQVVLMVTEYSLPTAGARDIAAARDRASIAALYGKHMMGRLVMTVPGLLIGLAGTLFSPVLRERPWFGALATLNGVVMAYNLGWYFQGTLRFRTSVLLEMFGFATSLVLILSLVRDSNDGALVLGCLLASTVAGAMLAHGIALAKMDRRAIVWRGGVRVLRGSAALFAHKSLNVLMTSSSTYLVSLFAAANVVGWYGAAERVVGVGLTLLTPAHQVLMRTVSFRISSRESEAAGFALMRKALIIVTLFGVVMFLGLLLVAPFAVPLVLGPDFGPSIRMLQVLSAVLPLAAFSQVVTGYVLIPLRMDSVVAKVSLFAATLTVTGIALLGPAFSGTGVACARVLGYVAMSLVLVVVLGRRGLIERMAASRGT